MSLFYALKWYFAKVFRIQGGDSRNHIKSPTLPRGKPDLPQFQQK